jgi:hypothetical protein
MWRRTCNDKSNRRSFDCAADKSVSSFAQDDTVWVGLERTDNGSSDDNGTATTTARATATAKKCESYEE